MSNGPSLLPEILASIATGLLFIYASQNVPLDLSNLSDLLEVVAILAVIGVIWWGAFKVRLARRKK